MSRLTRNQSGEIGKDALAGALGGLVAAFAMNQFQSLWKAAATKLQGKKDDSSQSGDDATVKTAEAVSRAVTGQGLDPENKKTAGAAVHFVYGTSIGAIYGALARSVPEVTAGRGTAYGAAAWLGGDEIAVPAFGLSDPPSKVPVSSHVSALAAHVIYGAVTDGVFRLLTRR